MDMCLLFGIFLQQKKRSFWSGGNARSVDTKQGRTCSGPISARLVDCFAALECHLAFPICTLVPARRKEAD